MKRIKTLIVEDEEGPLIVLRNKIHKFCPQLDIIGESSTVEQGLMMIEKFQPTLIFLDIQLGNETSFDLISQLTNKDIHVIFVTGYNDYALKAFQYNALHYILKPIETEELIIAVNRATAAEESIQQYQSAIENYRQDKWDKIAVPSVSKIVYIQLEKLIRLQSDGAYSLFFMENEKKIMSTKSLKEYDRLIGGDQFYRVHRSHLINLGKVSAYHKGENDTIVLTDGSSVEVSRKKRSEILTAIDDYNKSGN